MFIDKKYNEISAYLFYFYKNKCAFKLIFLTKLTVIILYLELFVHGKLDNFICFFVKEKI
jgi:hypothetical protein